MYCVKLPARSLSPFHNAVLSLDRSLDDWTVTVGWQISERWTLWKVFHGLSFDPRVGHHLTDLLGVIIVKFWQICLEFLYFYFSILNGLFVVFIFSLKRINLVLFSSNFFLQFHFYFLHICDLLFVILLLFLSFLLLLQQFIIAIFLYILNFVFIPLLG